MFAQGSRLSLLVLALLGLMVEEEGVILRTSNIRRNGKGRLVSD